MELTLTEYLLWARLGVSHKGINVILTRALYIIKHPILVEQWWPCGKQSNNCFVGMILFNSHSNHVIWLLLSYPLYWVKEETKAHDGNSKRSQVAQLVSIRADIQARVRPTLKSTFFSVHITRRRQRKLWLQEDKSYGSHVGILIYSVVYLLNVYVFTLWGALGWV